MRFFAHPNSVEGHAGFQTHLKTSPSLPNLLASARNFNGLLLHLYSETQFLIHYNERWNSIEN